MLTLSQVAERYIGKTETPNNSGFKDKTFEARMKAVGWLKSQAWCAYFAELCVVEWAREIGRKDIAALATKLFSGGSTATFKNMDIYAKANPKGILKVSTKQPVGVDFVVIFRHGTGWTGHTAVGIAGTTPPASFKTVEGNTNDAGGREGIEVARKKRNPNAPFSAKGLNIVGYFWFV
jgi:hypothetical protein